MAGARYHNFSGDVPPPPPPPPPLPKPKGTVAFISKDCQSVDGGGYFHWSYTGADIDTLTGYWVRVATAASKTTIVKEVFVAEPDTDAEVTGLTNKTAYVATVTAVNPSGESAPSAAYPFTPDVPLIAAPVLKTLTGGDGLASTVWEWGAEKDGFKFDWVSYEAVNELGQTVSEHVVGGDYPATSGTCPLNNDHEWTVYLVAIATQTASNKQYISAPSASMKVRTEQKLPPFKPRLTGAQMNNANNGQIDVAFAPGIQNVTALRPDKWWRRKLRADNGRTDITAWQVRVTKGSETYTYDVTDGQARAFTTPKVALGTWVVDCRAINPEGNSDWSNELAVTYSPTDKRPFTADKTFSTWESDSYYYAIFDPGNDPKDGWERTWKCTLTAPGKLLNYEVLAVGAGGGAKGQTATFGKGGNGGGGELVEGKLTGSEQDTFTVLVSIGGTVSIDPKDTIVTGKATTTARSGKSASSGTDAAGYPSMDVGAWKDCKTAFGWLTPYSESVGGVAQDGRQGYPNGLGWGCAGAGTKTSNPGKGIEGLVVIRWPK